MTSTEILHDLQNATETEKHLAFEWLRGQACDGGHREAGILMLEIERLRAIEKGRPAPQSPEATAAGLTFCCGDMEERCSEIHRLRNVLQAAFNGQDVIEAYRRVMHEDLVPQFDLVAHLIRQRAFSERTFGPGPRTAGVLDHIRKELKEIEAAPADLSEWVDVILLALDGAWRAGHEPAAIAAGIEQKQSKNEARTWPDWRTVPADRAIEHNR